MTCSYIDDIYLVRDLLRSQDDIKPIRTSDYIKNPKPNGYRSLPLIVTVRVFLTTKVEIVNVKILIRTIAMDFWASLDQNWRINSPTGKEILLYWKINGFTRQENCFYVAILKPKTTA